MLKKVKGRMFVKGKKKNKSKNINKYLKEKSAMVITDLKLLADVIF